MIMNRDAHMIFESFADKQKAREQLNPPHGYPQGITAVQNMLITQLQKLGFALTKISHVDKERDKYPTVFMVRSQGPMHNVVEIDGMGSINGEHYKDYMANLKDASEDAESADEKKERVQRGWQINKNRWAKWKMENPEAAAKHAAKKAGKSENAEDARASKPFQYNAMTHLTQAANAIRDILQSHADDEAQTEHIIKMAQIILGPKSDHTDAEYRKMLDGLIVMLNRFIIVPMN
jgi:hypothetical protein